MNWLNTAAMIVHMFLAVAIIGLVLLQKGKGAEAGAGFGAGASGTVFGARGSASFLSRTTAILAALFFVTSLTLTGLGSRKPVSSSIVDSVPAVEAPAAASSSSVTLEVPSAPAAPAATNGAPPAK
jgi:preprotein translocase subunit SecG